ncbi:alkaline phosphatase PhoX, partial [Acinetobacter baumannii]
GSLARAQASGGIRFKAIGLSTEDRLLLAEGYSSGVVIRWGDPIARGARRFDLANGSARDQEAAFGYNCDYLSYLPLPYGSSGSSRA